MNLIRSHKSPVQAVCLQGGGIMPMSLFKRSKQSQKLTKRDVIVLVSSLVYLASNVGAGLILAQVYTG